MDRDRNAQRAVGEEQAPDHPRQGVIPAGPDARAKVDPEKTPGAGALPDPDTKDIDPGSE
ncbi:hypothetical protein [Rhizobium sp. SSA_523]|uniref:hypothetical protein n=1 Tax=Rhizobium sp. SSA_523 TaxID=2952477 RepID=UPI00209151B0|nr:hypothetical protein [Rhizobium sp. SSA_523]MCO5734479.1 hypothetical protein [Rhizobium sp. SSA_523]WKC23272.1 hypothetical protein QTJ18_21005 [Rhizobium sp. SSA_523]